MNVIKITSMGILGGLAYLLGGWDMGLEVFCIMVVLDYITGIMKGISNKELSSYLGLKVILKKVCLFILIAVAVQIERMTNQPETIHNVISYALVVNEAISILENIKEMGVPIPDVLIKLLDVIKQKK
jgi:toxin secretion/phage lysis holin